jgi:RNA:NAD 2'-phosphotransferase (TPT1/KptA family)
MLLDDIDTADDIAKADDKLYRSICQRHQKKRWEILSEEEVDAAIRAKEKNT